MPLTRALASIVQHYELPAAARQLSCHLTRWKLRETQQSLPRLCSCAPRQACAKTRYKKALSEDIWSDYVLLATLELSSVASTEDQDRSMTRKSCNRIVLLARSKSRGLHLSASMLHPAQSPAAQLGPTPSGGSWSSVAFFSRPIRRILDPLGGSEPCGHSTARARHRRREGISSLPPCVATPGRRCWRGGGRRAAVSFTSQPGFCQPEVAFGCCWAFVGAAAVRASTFGKGAPTGASIARTCSHWEGRSWDSWRRRQRRW